MKTKNLKKYPFNKFLRSKEITKIIRVNKISHRIICLIKSNRNVFVFSLSVKLLSTIIIQSVVRASKEFAAIEIVYSSRKFVLNKMIEHRTFKNNDTQAIYKNLFLSI